MGQNKGKDRLVLITLDEASLGRGTPDQEHERVIAVYDLLEVNHFAIPGRDHGPYKLIISLIERKLCLDIRSESDQPIIVHFLSLTPFKRVIKDYDMVCESYYEAIRTSSPAQIEAIDMGRRGLHNEAAEILMERIEGKLSIDHDTARRLFTLIFALHWKG
ncbi:MAG: UPF0262 family protein [Hyphomicrobiales bacterium]|jgi:uncharacterized protein (UPF0262 family)|nr:UPF0262 family protein [Hyphomicrobiales bacterium]